MPLTNPWLTTPPTKRQLDHDHLSERILNLLSSQNMCVLATTRPDGPLATPVRYYHLDFTLLFTASGRSPKMRNLGQDPRVSIGVFAPLVGIASSRGAQIFGQAKVLEPGDPQYGGFWEAFRWQSEHAEQGGLLDEPPGGPMVAVEAERIVYTEHWLRRDGYAARQFWRRDQQRVTPGNGSVGV
jgi:nitroimidazol reductase NimA-like FMN-containing flavoprotein (pyridoxamine 5'-phosphate oxidase superfamily)